MSEPGSVSTASPLTVLLDSSATPLPALSLGSYTPVVVGDRVSVDRQGSQLVVLGTLGVEPVPTPPAASTFGTLPTAPTSQLSVGTSTSGTTETRDTVWGSYAFTAAAGRRYQVVVAGALMSGSVIGDLWRVNIRNGGSSTPTAASTAVASTQVYTSVAGGGGQVQVSLGGSFVPGAGAVTLSVFVARQAGTGIGNLVSGAVARELYVVDKGMI